MKPGSTLPEIKGFHKNTLMDWDGQIASIVFLGSCNFRCPYCHAAPLVMTPDTEPNVPIEEIDRYLNGSRGWIDGIIITGGEPTLQPHLPELIDHFRDLGLGVKLFTNGSRPEVLRNLLDTQRLTAVSMDIKAPLDERYHRAAGVEADLDAIRESIDVIMNSGIPYWFRTTVCPAVLTFEDIIDTAKEIEGAESLVLQPFRPVDCLDPVFEQIEPYAGVELTKMAEFAARYVKKCTVS